MRKRVRFLPVLVVLWVCCSSFISNSNWVQVKVQKHGYQIEFPQQPSERPRAFHNDGSEIQIHVLMLEASKTGKPDDNALYQVMSAESPRKEVHSDNPALLPDYFRGTIDGAVQSVQGKLLSEKEIVLNGYPGREVKASFQNGKAIIKMRMFLVGGQTYTLQVLTAADKDNNPSIDRFLNSFKLLKK